MKTVGVAVQESEDIEVSPFMRQSLQLGKKKVQEANIHCCRKQDATQFIVFDFLDISTALTHYPYRLSAIARTVICPVIFTPTIAAKHSLTHESDDYHGHNRKHCISVCQNQSKVEPSPSLELKVQAEC
jgi:hypothetical protein